MNSFQPLHIIPNTAVTDHTHVYLAVFARGRRKVTWILVSLTTEHSSSFPAQEKKHTYLHLLFYYTLHFDLYTCAVLCSAVRASCQKLVVRGTDVEASRAEAGNNITQKLSHASRIFLLSHAGTCR